MKSIRTLAVLVSVFLSATAAQADDNWRIVESAGAVKAGGAGLMPAAVKSDQLLPSNAWVETAGTGRVVLVRGLESIAVGPNSRVQLPSLEVNGNTQVLQTLGSAFYQIGKQQKPHFQVDTPYLAAVVKGTTFTVTVDDGVASVQVTEGLVEVATPDRADVEFVRPGFTGVVSREHKGDVVVVQSERGGAQPPSTNGKSKDKSTSLQPIGKLAAANRVVIAHAIGETKVDVKAATGGLAHNAVEPVAATKDSKDAKLSNDNAVTKTATGVLASLGNVVTDVAGGTRSENAATPATPAIPAVPAVGLALGPVNLNIGGAAPDVGAGNGNGVGLGVGLDVGNGNGGGAAPDLGGGNGVGVGVDVGLGGGSGNSGGSGSGNGGVGVGVDLGVGAGGVGVGVGLNLGNGNGLGLGLGLGGGNGNGNGGGLLGLGH